MRNLADPDYEPSDDELRTLSKEAFAGVAALHHASLARLRDEIAAQRAKVLAELDRREAKAR